MPPVASSDSSAYRPPSGDPPGATTQPSPDGNLLLDAPQGRSAPLPPRSGDVAGSAPVALIGPSVGRGAGAGAGAGTGTGVGAAGAGRRGRRGAGGRAG